MGSWDRRCVGETVLGALLGDVLGLLHAVAQQVSLGDALGTLLAAKHSYGPGCLLESWGRRH